MQRTVLKQRLCAAQDVARRSPGAALRGLHSLLRLTAVFALLLGSCAKDPVGPGGPDEGTDLALYIPAPERVETYSGATIDECRIDNAVVLACKDGRITGAEVVDIILGNGTQQPTLRFRKLDPANGETIVVLCNLDPATVNQAEGLIGQNMTAAQNTLKPRSAAGGASADMKAPLTMAGEGVWDVQNRNAQVRMTFQCAKISVVLDPSLTAEGGPLAWTTVRTTCLDHMPVCSNWKTASTPSPQNEQGTLSQSGTPGYDPDADPMSFPALYTYEATKPANWPANRAFNYVLLQVADANGNPAQYYCLTYDQTDQGRITAYRPFERGKHYVFRVKDIYKRGYDNPDEALDNPSSALCEIDVSDDWSNNGQYAVAADRDTAYVWTTTVAQPLYRFSWPHPADDPDGAPATSSVKLLKADKKTPVETSLVQLLDENGQTIANNTFTFDGQNSPEAGYQFSFKTGKNATAPTGMMWLGVRCGNIERFVPVGWATFSVQDIETTYLGGAEQSQIVSRVAFGDKTETLGWTARFLDEQGNEISKPDWVSQFPMSGEGDVTAEVTLKAKERNPVLLTPHDDELRKRTSIPSGLTKANMAYPTATNPFPNVRNRIDLSTSYQGLGDRDPVETPGNITYYRETANCYIVNRAGFYRIPAVYGNAVIGTTHNTASYRGNDTGSPFLNYKGTRITASYCQNDLSASASDFSVKLIWQDYPNLITECFYTDSPDMSLCFDVEQEHIRQGNALIGLYYTNPTTRVTSLVWTWHIWITNYLDLVETPPVYQTYDPALPVADVKIQNTAGTEFTIMSANLGWCNGEIEVYEERSVEVCFTQEATGKKRRMTITQPAANIEQSGNNPYYQWGRKDPLQAAFPGNTNKPFYDVNNTLQTDMPVVNASPSLTTVMQNPTTFYYGGKWTSNLNNYYWNAASTTVGSPNTYNEAVVKSVYDPCPRGYRVPDADTFTGISAGGLSYGSDVANPFSFDKINSPFHNTNNFVAIKGWLFYANRMEQEGNSYVPDPRMGVFPLRASGHRYFANANGRFGGVAYAVGEACNYWTNRLHITATATSPAAYSTAINSTRVLPQAVRRDGAGNNVTYGFAVRCIRNDVAGRNPTLYKPRNLKALHQAHEGGGN